MHKVIIIFFILFNCSCVMHNVAMESAKVLEPGESKHGIDFHYSYLHDENTLEKRLGEKLRVNNYKSDLKYGLSLNLRRGISKKLDMGGHISLDSLSLDSKYQMYKGHDYHLSLGAKVQVPSFSIDKLLAFAPVVTIYNSYDFHPSLELFLNPFYVFYPDFKPKRHVLGATLGAFFGRCHQYSIAYTYQQLMDYSFEESSEQVSIGISFYNLDKNKKIKIETEQDKHKMFLTFGMTYEKILSLGLLSSFVLKNKDSLDFIFKIGAGPFNEPLDENYSKSSIDYLLMSARYGVYFFPRLDVKTNFGLARRELTFNVESDFGWKQVQVTNHGLSVSFSYEYKKYKIDFMEFFIPLFANKAKYYYVFENDWQATQDYKTIGNKWSKRISLSLLDFKLSF